MVGVKQGCAFCSITSFAVSNGFVSLHLKMKIKHAFCMDLGEESLSKPLEI